jgi:uncharacterized protein
MRRVLGVPLGKVLVLLLVAMAVWFLVKGLGRPAARERRPAETGTGERMVTCARCGVHLPESEATASGVRFFCSEEHRRLGEP